ncbi:MAG TPA: DUF2269 family protein [Thermoleophilaceae bacterium]|jgi:hypothetical protein|nr:DUF2269 family protein [Thermoleophilaceae bacterium]
MTLYELLLFIHIGASIVWIGAGFLSLVLATTYDRESDEAAIKRFLKDQEWLAMRLFVPASLVVVIFGIALVIESDAWSFDQLWIILGLVGYAATFVTGLFFIKPASERIAAEMEGQGGRLWPRLRADIRKLIVTARVDYVTFALVVFDMVAKPTGDDVGVLVAMAVILAIGIAYIVVSVRAIEAETAQAPAPA